MSDWCPPNRSDPNAGPLRAALPMSGWRDAVARIVALHGLEAQGWEPFPTGSDVVFGAAYAVIKLTEPRWAAELRNEARFLAHVGETSTLEVPRPLLGGELSGWPYLVMTRVGGTALDEVWPSLDHGERVVLAARLGELMAALHRGPLPVEVRDVPETTPQGWRDFVAARRAGVVAHHRSRGVPEPWLEGIEGFLASVERPAAPLRLLHTELLTHHILLAPSSDGWRPTGLIDFADARLGHPDYDVAALVEFVFKGEHGLLGACLRAYGWPHTALNHDGARRLCAWGLLHRFGDLTRALAAAGDVEPGDFDTLCRRVYSLEV